MNDPNVPVFDPLAQPGPQPSVASSVRPPLSYGDPPRVIPPPEPARSVPLPPADGEAEGKPVPPAPPPRWVREAIGKLVYPTWKKGVLGVVLAGAAGGAWWLTAGRTGTAVDDRLTARAATPEASPASNQSSDERPDPAPEPTPDVPQLAAREPKQTPLVSAPEIPDMPVVQIPKPDPVSADFEIPKPKLVEAAQPPKKVVHAQAVEPVAIQPPTIDPLPSAVPDFPIPSLTGIPPATTELSPAPVAVTQPETPALSPGVPAIPPVVNPEPPPPAPSMPSPSLPGLAPESGPVILPDPSEVGTAPPPRPEVPVPDVARVNPEPVVRAEPVSAVRPPAVTDSGRSASPDLPPPPDGEMMAVRPATMAREITPPASPTDARTDFDVDLHEPRPGDTYESIGRQHYGDAKYGEALRAFNGGRPIGAGGPVQVPPMYVLRQRFRDRIGAPRPAYQPAPSADPNWDREGNPAVEWSPASSRTGSEPRDYSVPRPGMTLLEVADNLYGDRRAWRKLWDANPHIDPNERLAAGTRLQLPAEGWR